MHSITRDPYNTYTNNELVPFQKMPKNNLTNNPPSLIKRKNSTEMEEKRVQKKTKYTVEELNQTLEELYQNYLNKRKTFENEQYGTPLPYWVKPRLSEKIFDEISAQVYHPSSDVLIKFINTVEKGSSVNILDLYNVSVFWELATKYKILWLVDDCKKILNKPKLENDKQEDIFLTRK